MVHSRTKKIVLLLTLLCTGIGGFYLYQHYYSQTIVSQDNIYDFNPERDTKDIMDIFHENWYWLLASKESSPAFMIKYKTWDANPAHFGLMRIKVLRENNKVAGFTTYYMESLTKGRLLFLAVDQDFRGKGYGKLLAKVAMKELFAMGATHIALWTRISNVPAQRIYKELGFKEIFDQNGYLYFEYWPK